MPRTEERIDAIERDVAEIRGQIFEIRASQKLHTLALGQCNEQVSYLRTGQHELRKGQEELHKGQDELRATTADLRTGQEELRAITDDLRTGQEELRKGQDELRKGQDEIRETLEGFRSAFAVVLDEVRQQKAWREEFSHKLARVIAKSEGLDA